MEEIIRFLNENSLGAFATVDEGKPQVRPWGFMFAEDGKFYFCTANTKDVYRQLQKVPYGAFTATSKDMVTVRLQGKVTFIDDKAIKQKVLDTHEHLKKIYPSGDDPKFEVFYIEHGEASICDFGHPPEWITF